MLYNLYMKVAPDARLRFVMLDWEGGGANLLVFESRLGKWLHDIFAHSMPLAVQAPNLELTSGPHPCRPT